MRHSDITIPLCSRLISQSPSASSFAPPLMRFRPCPAILASFVVSLSLGPWIAVSTPVDLPVRPDSSLRSEWPVPRAAEPPQVNPDLPRAAAERARTRRNRQEKVSLPWFHGGKIQGRYIALTFDDGPHPVNTPRILDVLGREGIHATFFLVGAHAERYPNVVRRIMAEGHEIGNHSYHHYSFPALARHEVKEEIARTEAAFQRILGSGTRWVRAPGCVYTPEALEVMRNLGLVRVDTSANSGDWQATSVAAILGRTLRHLSPGDVVLCHDRMPLTVKALPRLLRAFRERHYKVVPLTDLALQAQQTPRFHARAWPLDEGVRLVAAKVVTPSPTPTEQLPQGATPSRLAAKPVLRHERRPPPRMASALAASSPFASRGRQGGRGLSSPGASIGHRRNRKLALRPGDRGGPAARRSRTAGGSPAPKGAVQPPSFAAPSMPAVPEANSAAPPATSDPPGASNDGGASNP